MATRSALGLQQADGSIVSVYCRDFGSFGLLGRDLFLYYRDRSKVARLIALGHLSRVGREVGPANVFGPNLDDTITLAYGRDRGEADTEPNPCFSARDFLEVALGGDADYAYLFRRGQWYGTALEIVGKKSRPSLERVRFKTLTPARVGDPEAPPHRPTSRSNPEDDRRTEAPRSAPYDRVRKAWEALTWLTEQTSPSSDLPFEATQEVARWLGPGTTRAALERVAFALGELDDAEHFASRPPRESSPRPLDRATWGASRALVLYTLRTDSFLRRDDLLPGEYQGAEENLRACVADAIQDPDPDARLARARIILDPRA